MRWSIIASVNDRRILENSLLRSPDIVAGADAVFRSGFASAGEAYNSAMDASDGEILVFAHQDVYFPGGWLASLFESVRRIEQTDPDWGVIGVFGVDRGGVHRGYVYSTGLGSLLGEPFRNPVAAQSIDEMVIVVRRSTGLRFDPDLPGFHLYGTDICLEATRRGFRSYIISDFCIHNSNGIGNGLPADFWRAYRYMRRKWMAELPVNTPCVTIHRSLLRSIYLRGRSEAEKRFRRSVPGTRVEDPSLLLNSVYAVH